MILHGGPTTLLNRLIEINLLFIIKYRIFYEFDNYLIIVL
jgi:hypothetical protein